MCKSCQHVFRNKKKAVCLTEAAKRVRVSKATKRASETSEQTLHRKHSIAPRVPHFSALVLAAILTEF